MCQHGSGNVVTSNSQTEAQFPCERTRSMQLPTSYPTRSQAIQMFMKNAHQQNPFSGNSAIPARSEARRIGLRQATTRQERRPDIKQKLRYAPPRNLTRKTRDAVARIATMAES